MSEEENKLENRQEALIQLSAPEALDDASFKKLIQNDLEQNSKDYLGELAARFHLDMEKDRSVVLDKAYDEQLDVIVQACVTDALNENTSASYSTLEHCCYFSDENLAYIRVVEGEKFAASQVRYIEERLENVQALKPVVDFTHSINEAILYSMGDFPNFNTYHANLINEKFENTEIILNNNEKAKLNFIISKLYRQIEAKNAGYGPYADNCARGQELDCLKKVLALSSDYKLIAYCQDRLPENDSEKNVTRAYKRALTHKQTRNDMYKINNALADLYLKKTNTIGYFVPNSDQVLAGEQAVQYLMNAYRYASKEDRLPILKKMAQTQLVLGKKEDWKNIKEVIAMKFLKGQERCKALISIADDTGDVSFYEKALAEAEKGRMNKTDKINVQEMSYSGILKYSKSEEKKANARELLSVVRNQKNNILNSLLTISGTKEKS